MYLKQHLFCYMKYLDKDLFNIIFLDNHILVAEKKAGITTQKTSSLKKSLECLLQEFLRKKLNKKNVFLHAVHRIDKKTSGLVLFARSSKALSRLNLFMRERKIVKKYRCLVENIFDEKDGVLEHFLEHKDSYSKVFKTFHENSKKAVLHYKALEERENFSYLEVFLKTGRYHQIRSQLAFMGHPIAGDSKYGSDVCLDGDIFLNSYFLEFDHPVLKEKKSFFSSHKKEDFFKKVFP